MTPSNPASSIASMAAAAEFVRPAIGHPLGIIQRPVSRDETSMISNLPSVTRHGSAATCSRSFDAAETARLIVFLAFLRALSGFPLVTPAGPSN